MELFWLGPALLVRRIKRSPESWRAPEIPCNGH